MPSGKAFVLFSRRILAPHEAIDHCLTHSYNAAQHHKFVVLFRGEGRSLGENGTNGETDEGKETRRSNVSESRVLRESVT
jgi:hypothetical protein